MRTEDIKVRKEGKSVDCMMMCRSRNQALHALAYADDNPPLGYILLMGKTKGTAVGGIFKYKNT